MSTSDFLDRVATVTRVYLSEHDLKLSDHPGDVGSVMETVLEVLTIDRTLDWRKERGLPDV